MKALMLSIRPVWCEKIANGKKTIEIRKTRPKLDTPFKVYIYCTKDAKKQLYQSPSGFYCNNHISTEALNGKVIGEFVCDRIYCYASDFGGCRPSDPGDISTEEISKLSCLTPEELYNYEHSAEPKENCIYLYGVYGWHISQLQIYDKPKELSEFLVEDNRTFDCPGLVSMKRPPQSWCYVEGME